MKNATPTVKTRPVCPICKRSDGFDLDAKGGPVCTWFHASPVTAAKLLVWIEVRPVSGGFEAAIVTKFGGVCGVASGKTADLAVIDVSRSLREPLPVRVAA